MTAFYLLTSGIFTVLELLFASHGIMISFLPCFIFYASGAWGGGRGLAAAIFTGLVADLVMGYFFPYRMFIFVLIALYARWCIRKIHGAHFFDLVLPGAILPLPVWLIPALFSSSDAFFETLLFLLPACCISAILLPVMTWVLDEAAEKFCIRRFADDPGQDEGEKMS